MLTRIIFVYALPLLWARDSHGRAQQSMECGKGIHVVCIDNTKILMDVSICLYSEKHNHLPQLLSLPCEPGVGILNSLKLRPSLFLSIEKGKVI